MGEQSTPGRAAARKAIGMATQGGGGFEELPFREFLTQLAEKSPTPGGGAAASAVGALAAALAGMVVSYSLGKKNLAPHEPALQEAAGVLARASSLMMRLADEDAAAYGAVNELSRLPEGDPRRALLAEAQRASVQAPMAMMAACVDLLRLFEELAGKTNRHLRSDLAIAAVLADAAAAAGGWNVWINLPTLPEGVREEFSRDAAMMQREASERRTRVEEACRS